MSNTSRRKFLVNASAATFGISPFVRAATRTFLNKRLELTTLDNGRVPIDEAALGILRQNLKGRLLMAESKDYEGQIIIEDSQIGIEEVVNIEISVME